MEASANRRRLYLVTLSVSIAFVALGVASAWPTPVLIKFEKNETYVDIQNNEIATMLALYPVGFAIGSVATRYIADMYGRRTTILGSALPIAIGSTIVILAEKAWPLYITAIFWNCGTGMLSTVIGYYITEIADKDVRGTLSMITGFTFKLGTLLTMSIGPFLSYYILNCIMLVLPILSCAICWWIPETPHFCLKAGNVEAARKSLQKLRGYKNLQALDEELTALQADVKNEMSHSSSIRELFTGEQYRKAIIIACGLKITQIMTGAVVIKQYLGRIIEESELDLDISIVMIIFGGITFVVGFMTSILVDRVGRRPLLIYSYMGTGFSLAAVGFYFFFKDFVHISSNILKIFSFVPFLGIILSQIISTIGFNSLIFLIPAEIFPLNVKAIAMTSLNLFGCLLGFIMGKGFQPIKEYFGLYTAFWIFATVAIGGGIFSYIIVTETKGKQLRDIQVELQGNMYDPVDNKDNLEVSTADDAKDTELKELKKNNDTHVFS